MPLPLLIPFAAASASTIAGYVAGGLFAIGGGYTYWYYSGQKDDFEEEIREHVQNAQNEDSKQRIERINNIFGQAIPEIRSAVDTIEGTKLRNTEIINKFCQFATESKEINQGLFDIIRETNHALGNVNPGELKISAEETETFAKETLVKMKKLADLIQSKEQKLQGAQKEIELLKETLDKQIVNTNQLQDMLNQLITEKDDLAQQLEAKEKNIKSLEVKTKQLLDYARFFKQAASQKTAPEERYENQSEFNSTQI